MQFTTHKQTASQSHLWYTCTCHIVKSGYLSLIVTLLWKRNVMVCEVCVSHGGDTDMGRGLLPTVYHAKIKFHDHTLSELTNILYLLALVILPLVLIGWHNHRRKLTFIIFFIIGWHTLYFSSYWLNILDLSLLHMSSVRWMLVQVENKIFVTSDRECGSGVVNLFYF